MKYFKNSRIKKNPIFFKKSIIKEIQTKSLWLQYEYAPQKCVFLSTESLNYLAHIFLYAIECQQLFGAYFLMRHKNIFVEHAFLCAPQKIFLPITVSY
jgi:hypothetical protein